LLYVFVNKNIIKLFNHITGPTQLTTVFLASFQNLEVMLAGLLGILDFK